MRGVFVAVILALLGPAWACSKSQAPSAAATPCDVGYTYVNDVCVPNGVAEAEMSALTNVAIDTEPDGGKKFLASHLLVGVGADAGISSKAAAATLFNGYGGVINGAIPAARFYRVLFPDAGYASLVDGGSRKSETHGTQVASIIGAPNDGLPGPNAILSGLDCIAYDLSPQGVLAEYNLGEDVRPYAVQSVVIAGL